jgi:hypothetical protein
LYGFRYFSDRIKYFMPNVSAKLFLIAAAKIPKDSG